MNTIGFIGYGNMAGAIAGGIIKSQLVKAQDMCVYDINAYAMSAAASLGLTLCDSQNTVITNADMIFLCVKPQSFTELLTHISAYIRPDTVLVSIAAGVSTAAIAKYTNESVAIIRAMPNTPLLLGCGTTALCDNGRADAASVKLVHDIFGGVGTVYDLPEDKFNDIINVNGSTPAYIYLFAQTIADFADERGIDYKTALDMFCDTLKGSAEMLKYSGKSPQELIEMVSSKGGTTIAALNTFANTKLVNSLRAGMEACVQRAEELSI